MTSDVFLCLPDVLSIGHLHRTWLYWVLVVLLFTEMLYFQPRSLKFLRQYGTEAKSPSDLWGSARSPSTKVIVAVALTSTLSILTFVTLLLASAAAFYTALLGLIPAALRFADEIPHATTGETIGAAIGSFIGVALQTVFIIAIISSVNPTSQFPFRLATHLDQKAVQ